MNNIYSSFQMNRPYQNSREIGKWGIRELGSKLNRESTKLKIAVSLELFL